MNPQEPRDWETISLVTVFCLVMGGGFIYLGLLMARTFA